MARGENEPVAVQPLGMRCVIRQLAPEEHGADLRTAHPVGYTLGAGVEYAFTNSYALRAEYRASAYRAFSTPLDGAAAGTTVSRRETDNRLQAGISYRFGPLAPAAE